MILAGLGHLLSGMNCLSFYNFDATFGIILVILIEVVIVLMGAAITEFFGILLLNFSEYILNF